MSVSKTMKEHHGEMISAAGSDVLINGNDQPDSHSATHTGRRENRPSPSIHEDVIARYNVRNPETGSPVPDPVLSKMEDAVQTARLAAERAGKVAAAILQNEMQTIPARHRQVQQEAWRAIDPALRALDSARQNANQALQTLSERTGAPPKPKDAMAFMQAHEIRTVLRSMSDIDREAALGKALAEDDDIVLGAVICAPPMLSGLSIARQGTLRSAWQKRRHGDDIDRLERLTKALADLDRAGELTINYASGLCDSKIISRAEASEAAVRDALRAS